MNDYNLNFFYVEKNFPTLMEGLFTSLQMTLGSIVIGMTLGFIVAGMRMSPYKIIAWPATAFIEFFRCTPALIQIVWFYFCIPIIFDIYIDPFITVLLALGLNLTAFNAEAYRAALQAIPKLQNEAGIALGLSRLQRIIYIELPQAFRMAIPVLMTNGIGSFQQSALISTVAIADLMYEGKILATQTYRPIETLTVVALIYFAISMPISTIVKRIEDRMQAKIAG